MLQAQLGKKSGRKLASGNTVKHVLRDMEIGHPSSFREKVAVVYATRESLRATEKKEGCLEGTPPSPPHLTQRIKSRAKIALAVSWRLHGRKSVSELGKAGHEFGQRLPEGSEQTCWSCRSLSLPSG